MKTKNSTKPIFALTLLFGALCWGGCGTTDDNGPCPEEDWVYDIRHLDHDYDSLFPYDVTQKTLTYLYSNDTIEGDTLVFELYKTDTMEITGNSWSGGGGGCTVYADEMKTFIYRSIEGLVSKKMRISWESLSTCTIQIVDEESDFDPPYFSRYGFPFGYYNDKVREGSLESSTINGISYHFLLSNIDSFHVSSNQFCIGKTIASKYSSRFGFIEMRNTCNNDYFSLIK